MLNKSNETLPPALSVAAFTGSIDYIQPLLEANADIEICWGHYGTPLGAACLAGHLEAVRYLVERGAKTSWIGSDGKLTTAMEKAKDHKHVVRWLQEREEHIPLNKAAIVYYAPLTASCQFRVTKRGLPQLADHVLQELHHTSLTRQRSQISPTNHICIPNALTSSPLSLASVSLACDPSASCL